jgi:hypothetical protein
MTWLIRWLNVTLAVAMIVMLLWLAAGGTIDCLHRNCAAFPQPLELI